MKKRALLIATVIGLELILILARNSLRATLAQPILEAADYQAFASQVRTLTIGGGLLCLFLFLYLPSPPAQQGHSETSRPLTAFRGWTAAFWLLLGMSIILTSVSNPDGRLPWNRRDINLSIAARPLKLRLYEQLDRTPDILVLGSSVSFTMPMDFFKTKWNLRAFNWSVNGGGPSDFPTLINYSLARRSTQEMPRLIMIELVRRNLEGGSPQEMPLEMLPYMNFQQGQTALFSLVTNSLTLSSISDSVFTLSFVDQDRWTRYISFAPDGSGIRAPSVTSAAGYRKRLRSDIGLEKWLLSCQELNQEGMKHIEQIAELSEQHHFSILFFTTPVNADFYRITNTKSRDFRDCQQLLAEYMQALTARHPGVIFRDLSNYGPIARGGSDLYIDNHHLTPQGNRLLLEALSPDILSALEGPDLNQ